MKDEIIISVIVPVYQAEATIARCIDRILQQKFTKFELLLVNNGSTDNSGNICDSYAISDARVRVFHKVNGGVSSARNVGIEKAQGLWRCFIDADDWVESDFLYSFDVFSLSPDIFPMQFSYRDETNQCFIGEYWMDNNFV